MSTDRARCSCSICHILLFRFASNEDITTSKCSVFFKICIKRHLRIRNLYSSLFSHSVSFGSKRCNRDCFSASRASRTARVLLCLSRHRHRRERTQIRYSYRKASAKRRCLVATPMPKHKSSSPMSLHCRVNHRPFLLAPISRRSYCTSPPNPLQRITPITADAPNEHTSHRYKPPDRDARVEREDRSLRAPLPYFSKNAQRMVLARIKDSVLSICRPLEAQEWLTVTPRRPSIR